MKVARRREKLEKSFIRSGVKERKTLVNSGMKMDRGGVRRVGMAGSHILQWLGLFVLKHCQVLTL